MKVQKTILTHVVHCCLAMVPTAPHKATSSLLINNLRGKEEEAVVFCQQYYCGGGDEWNHQPEEGLWWQLHQGMVPSWILHFFKVNSSGETLTSGILHMETCAEKSRIPPCSWGFINIYLVSLVDCKVKIIAQATVQINVHFCTVPLLQVKAGRLCAITNHESKVHRTCTNPTEDSTFRVIQLKKHVPVRSFPNFPFDFDLHTSKNYWKLMSFDWVRGNSGSASWWPVIELLGTNTNKYCNVQCSTQWLTCI